MQQRLIRNGDVPAVVELMQSIGVHFAGSRSARVLEAVARDGVDDPAHVTIALAVESKPTGIVVAFRQRAAYWRSFARRHPVAALAILAHRLRRRGPRRGSASTPRDDAHVDEVRALFAAQLAPLGAERWQDEASDIAKVMYVAVHLQSRGSGIGSGLYRWFFRDLADRGVVRCDAQVSANNVGAAKLHRQFPFRVHAVSGGYFLWLMTRDV